MMQFIPIPTVVLTLTTFWLFGQVPLHSQLSPVDLYILQLKLFQCLVLLL